MATLARESYSKRYNKTDMKSLMFAKSQKWTWVETSPGFSVFSKEPKIPYVGELKNEDVRKAWYGK